MVKKLQPLPPHVTDNFVKYNIPCPKGKPRVKQPPPVRLPLNRHHFTRSKPYSFDAPTKSWAVKKLVAQHMASKLFHIFNTTGYKNLLIPLKDPHSTTWTGAFSDELGRLVQGINNVKGNDVLDVILKSEVPSNRIVTYANMVCDYIPHTQDTYRVRLTVGGDRLPYNDDVVSPAASLLEIKLLLNSTISDASKGVRFMTLDIKDFPLQALMERPEYMRIHSKYFSQDMKNKYHIPSLVAGDGFVYCKIKRGMYGLKQAARLAYDNLVTNLNKKMDTSQINIVLIFGHTNLVLHNFVYAWMILVLNI